MNLLNRTLFIADNLDIMRGIDSECIDLIYLDPPFNSNKQYKAPIGSPAEGATFKDIWTNEDVKHHWHGEIAETHETLYQIVQASEFVYDRSMKLYLMAMAVRLVEMVRILKPTGSIYLHCDPTASHYLKLVMDSIFGKQNFQNEIVWCYKSGGASSKHFAKKHDILLFYSKNTTYTFNQLKEKSYQGTGYNTGNKKVHLYRDEHVNNLGPYTLVNLKDWWEIGILATSSKERTGYPTQKPLALLERLIKASSNENDIILDPFCGCATACVAAERLNRRWIGIDISPSAETITKIRLEEASEQGELFSPIQMSDVTVTSVPPVRTDNNTDVVIQRPLPAYQTHKHELYGKQEGQCNGCRLHFRIKNLSVDYITPRSKQGTEDHIENLQLLCNACNSIKGDRPQSYLYERLEERDRELRERLHVYQN